MRIAIPVEGGRLAPHLGHAARFAFFDVDPAEKRIISNEEVDAPEHQHGMLAGWLKARGVNAVFARGTRCGHLFEAASIELFAGVPIEDAATLVQQYLDGKLVTGANACCH